ncbi:ROK family protein [Phytohabitans sp. ZYX-F-186]|uniref:ROK family protein n=1 Tax=Phytohabitans maris TaxID=3071409 RepID=A0ABU0Z9G0_9ACTN|nr:ROK family protein [Phytohabitans sp. ZYX-F-186]MDQ7903679.1 ROK family protein [Phytohabitans sp. ZYX-F-186]
MHDPLSHATQPTGVGNTDLRRHNLSQVLKVVYAAGSATRVRIAESTGLTKTAVGGLAAQLIQYGLLEEDAAIAGRVGRPSPPLRFAGHHFTGACIEIRGSAIESIVTDLNGNPLTHRQDPIRLPSDQAPLDLVIAHAHAAHQHAVAAGKPLLGIALAVHGAVDPHTGRILFAPRLDWDNLDLHAAVTSQLPDAIPVIVDHDANLAAVAETAHQRNTTTENLVSISSDLGIGAGIVIAGKIYRGSHGYAAELGHMLLDPDGPACVCGRQGCWSALIGLRTVLREALPGTAAELERIRGYEAAGQSALAAAADTGDEATLAALEHAGTWLGLGAANIANMLDPDRIIIGGYLAHLSRWVMPAAYKAFTTQTLRPARPETTLLVSKLGDTRALHGGIHLLRTRLLNDPYQALTTA